MSLWIVGESPTARREDFPLERPPDIADLRTRHVLSGTETRSMRRTPEPLLADSANISRPSRAPSGSRATRGMTPG